MDLTVLGCSGGTPSRDAPSSGYLVEAGDTTVWLDAGTGTFMELAARIDPGTLDAVVISHIHVDHCADLFGLYGYMAFGPSGEVPVPVYVPPGAADHLAAFARAGEGHVFHRVLDLVTVEGGDSVAVGAVTLRFGAGAHSVPTVGTRVEDGSGVIAYTADTGPGGDVTRLVEGADLAVVEATFEGERTSQTSADHLTAVEAGELAASAGASRLILTHLPPTLGGTRSVDEASSAFAGEVSLARPGARFTV